MGRTKNALNKPKFIKVRISELNKVFNQDHEIEISRAYEYLFSGQTRIVEDFPVKIEEKIEFTIS